MLLDRPVVTVATAGTAVPCSTTLNDYASTVFLTADSANTGNAFAGGSTVNAALGRGIPLPKGAPVNLVLISPTFPGYDLNKIMIDSTASGDKVHVAFAIP